MTLPASAPGPRLVESGPLPYLLSAPVRQAGGEDGARPVLCFLHGYDEAAPAEIRSALTRHGPLRPGSCPGVLERCIVVAPQLPVAGDVWSRHAGAVARIVDDVRREHGGDPARTYLTGFSFGGNGVFDLVLLQPGRWAALWAVDPTRVPSRAIDRPVWLSVGQVARARRDAFVRALALRPADPRAPHPEGDRLYLDEGEDHVGSATRAYADARIYEWLLARRIDGAE